MLCVVLLALYMTYSDTFIRVWRCRTTGWNFRRRRWSTTHTHLSTARHISAAAGGITHAHSSCRPQWSSIHGIASLTTTSTIWRTFTWWSNCSEPPYSLLLSTSVDTHTQHGWFAQLHVNPHCYSWNIVVLWRRQLMSVWGTSHRLRIRDFCV